GGTVTRELRLDASACVAGDESVSGRVAIPNRRAAAGGTHRRTDDHARARDAAQQRDVLDGGPPRLFLHENGGGGGGSSRRRDLVRPHPRTLAPCRRRRPLREHGERGATEGR